MNTKFSIKTIVAIGIGSAVFVILGRFASIPTGIPNTSIETTYPFLALIGVIFGPVAGLFVGLIGHALKDLTLGYGIWWTWVIGSGIVGLIYGLAGRKIDIAHGVFGKKEIIRFNIYQLIANVLTWGAIAPTLDVLVYSEPANKVYVQGLVVSASDTIVVAIIGTLLLKAYAATRVKKGSLSKED